MSSICSAVRSAFDRICPSNVWLLFGFLLTAVPLAFAQSNPSNVSQAILASADNNGLSSPEAVAVSAEGNVFIADTGNNRVVEEPWNRANKTYGTQITVITNLVNPSSVVVGTSGNVYIADTGNNRVVELPWNPTTSTYGAETVVGSGLANPEGVRIRSTFCWINALTFNPAMYFPERSRSCSSRPLVSPKHPERGRRCKRNPLPVAGHDKDESPSAKYQSST
jgi:hypothetical protein